MQTLSTFAFDYPRRSEFFKKELTQLLILAQEKNLNPLSLKSSYAGAVGLPQFMPSNLRRYAVDFNQDGRVNIWQDVEDAIGSVANYLKEHGWQAKQPIAAPAKVKGVKYKTLKQQRNLPSFSLQQMQNYGIQARTALPADLQANLIELEGKEGPEFWLGFKNFYMIRRYNPSNNYAMAVYQLSEELKKMHSFSLSESIN